MNRFHGVIGRLSQLKVRVIAKLEREIRGIDFQGGESAESLGLDPELYNACMPSGGGI